MEKDEKTQKDQSSYVDKGKVALSGFLYQTIVALGVVAKPVSQLEDGNMTELNAFLTLQSSKEALFEYCDQDLALRSWKLEAESYSLVQVKYSRQTPLPNMTYSELEEIAQRLDTSAKRSTMLNHQISQYVLITNRPMGDDAKKKLEDFKKTFLKEKKPKSDMQALYNLLIISTISMDTWKERVVVFANTYGCIGDEVRRGFHEGLGRIFESVGSFNSPDITSTDLVEMFTNHPNARPITPECVAQYSLEQLTRFIRDAHLCPQRSSSPSCRGIEKLFLRRSVLDEIAKKAVDHAIIFVYGPGGCGKTATICQWMNELLYSVRGSQTALYTAIASAREVDPHFDYAATLLCLWANLPATHTWRYQNTLDHLLERLHVASSKKTEPPLYLCIDGLDEKKPSDNFASIERVIRWFIEEELKLREQKDGQKGIRPPRAVLVVSCRNPKAVSYLFRPLLDPLNMPSEIEKDRQIACVKVERFTLEEVTETANVYLSGELAKRFALNSRVDPLSIDGYHRFGPSHASFIQQETLETQPVHEETGEALRHPVLWRCLLSLDEHTQSCVLDGTVDAMRALAEKFLLWFCDKAAFHCRWSSDPPLQAILRRIARAAHQTGSLQYKKSLWVQRAIADGDVTSSGANELYAIAKFAGFILEVSDGVWRWYHAFVGEYLRSPYGEEL